MRTRTHRCMECLAAAAAMFMLTLPGVAQGAGVAAPRPLLRWTRDFNGAIDRAPLATQDLVLIAPRRGSLIALAASDGHTRWRFGAPGTIRERSFTVAGKQVLVGLRGGELVALGATDGLPRWRRRLTFDVVNAPLIVDGWAYVATSALDEHDTPRPRARTRIYALDLANGAVRWSVETVSYALQSPVLHGDTLYVGGIFQDAKAVEEGGHMRLYALNAANGIQRWTWRSKDGFPKRVYADSRAVVYLGYRDYLVGLSPEDGTERWRYDTGNWTPSFTGADGAIYFGSANNHVHAVATSDGARRWQHRISEGVFNYVLGAPALVDDTLYMLTQHGDVMALAAADGALRWRLHTGLEARTGLAATSDALYLGGVGGEVIAYALR